MADKFTIDAMSALAQYNSDHGETWTFGTNWSNVDTDFETFVNQYLFPKINETALVNVDLGNRFDWLAKEIDNVGQFSEEYVILDTIPVNVNLSKEVELMLQRKYPKMATKLYSQGVMRKVKFTLNNNDVRLNWLTLGDGIKYALAVYKKRISDINVVEEREIKAMLVDYALNHVKEKRAAASEEDFFNQTFQAILNIQNNSEKFNEAVTASGGALGRYTTVSKLKNVAILTTDSLKTYLLDSKLANTFQVAGIDISDRIISFDDLGGTYRLTNDVKITTNAQIETFNFYGDYQIAKDDILPKGTVLTFDVSGLGGQFVDNVIEIKPENELFGYVFDINKLKYRRCTKNMMKKPFYNAEFDEITYWLHYFAFKSVSPFYNSIVIGE